VTGLIRLPEYSFKIVVLETQCRSWVLLYDTVRLIQMHVPQRSICLWHAVDELPSFQPPDSLIELSLLLLKLTRIRMFYGYSHISNVLQSWYLECE